MDIFLSRQEIRRQACALAGYTDDLALSAQDRARIDGYIDAGSLKIAGANQWLSMQRRASVGLPADSAVISYRTIEEAYWMAQRYPTQYHPGTFGTSADPWYPSDIATFPLGNVGPGGIIEVAAWDNQKYEYYSLYKAQTPAQFDQDRWPDITAEAQLIAVSQGLTTAQVAAAVSNASGLRKNSRNKPYSYDPQSDGLHIWPLPDTPQGGLQYVLRVIYDITPTWTYQYGGMTTRQIDQIPSVVDAQAIIFFVVAQMFAQQGDNFQAGNYTDQFKSRIQELRARQATGESICADTESAFDNDYEVNRGRALPNWALGPIFR